jgi:predicted nucleic acid-binding protein
MVISSVLHVDMCNACAHVLRHGPHGSDPQRAARIWALRHNFTSYDASYVALAEALDAPLITCDAPLARAAAKFVDVEIVR